MTRFHHQLLFVQLQALADDDDNSSSTRTLSTKRATMRSRMARVDTSLFALTNATGWYRPPSRMSALDVADSYSNRSQAVDTCGHNVDTVVRFCKWCRTRRFRFCSCTSCCTSTIDDLFELAEASQSCIGVLMMGFGKLQVNVVVAYHSVDFFCVYSDDYGDEETGACFLMLLELKRFNGEI